MRVFALLIVLLVPATVLADDAHKPVPADPGHDTAQPARPELRPADLIKQKPDKKIDEMLLNGVSTIPISTVVDETIDDLVADLNKLDLARISPVAIRIVNVSPNLKATFARDLENRVVTALAQATTIKQVSCTACRAMRSRVENGEWVVSLGPVTQAEIAQLGRDLGVHAFMEIDFNFDSGTNVVTTRVQLVRPEDGVILWAEAYTSDTDTAALARGSDRAQTRADRIAELERLISGRPYYGYGASGGITIVPWGNPQHSPLIGATGGFKFYEKFGAEQRSMFGLDINAFANVTAPAYGGFIGLQYMHQVSNKSFFLPDIRVGGEAGGFLAGSQGNTFYFEGDAEVMLKFRLGIGVGLFYMLPVTYQNFDLGGLSYRIKLLFVW